METLTNRFRLLRGEMQDNLITIWHPLLGFCLELNKDETF